MTGRGWSVEAWRSWCQSHAATHGGDVAFLGPNEGLVRHLGTDTRALSRPSETIFFALVGPWHDGHDFLQDAHDAGVRHWVVGRAPREGESWAKDSDVLVVADVLLALQAHARAQRDTFTGPVLAITGSNGKTTVKEWIASLLPDHLAVHRSPLSHNSQLGVPLSVWSLENHHDLSMVEAGISHPGEMSRLRDCIHPTEGVLTHLGEAHLGNFDNEVHLAREKCTLFASCQRVFMPESLRDACAGLTQAQPVTWAFATEEGAGRASLVVDVSQGPGHALWTWRGTTSQVALSVSSEASVRNACTAVLVALHHGATMDKLAARLASLEELSGRLSTVKRPPGGVLIQDDCNHDLGSLEVALTALDSAASAATKVAIVGDVTQSGLDVHDRVQRIARLASDKALDALWMWVPHWNEENQSALAQAMETLSPSMDVHCETSLDGLVERAQNLKPADVLVKVASNAHLQPVLQALAPAQHVTSLTLNARALVDNVRLLKTHVGATGVIAVIKGLGYGTDPVVLGRLLEAQGVDWLAVAYADEGVALRKAGIKARILVLNPDPSTFNTMHAHALEPQLVSVNHVRAARNWAESNDVAGWPVHLKLDTGMHRLGLAEKEDAEAEQLLNASALELASVMSHLAGADDPSLDEATRSQIDAFHRRTSKRFSDVPRHILNSAGTSCVASIINDVNKSDWAPVLTHIRVGLAMFGLGGDAESIGLVPVLRLETSVSKLVKVPAGKGSGYGLTDAADHDRTLAVLAAGYADGYPRALGNGVGQVGWKGRLLPTVGRVCMDMMTVDVTGLDVAAGDRMTLWGEHPRLDRVSDQASTIPYELLARLGPRVQRVVQR